MKHKPTGRYTGFTMIGILILLAVTSLFIVAFGSAATIFRLTRPPRFSYAAALAHEMPLSPAELGFEFAEREFHLPDGAKTPAWVIAGERPAGPIVVVSHGWGDSRYGTQSYLPLLAPLASQVVLYDLRGQGGSTARQSRLGTREVDDLLAIVDQLDTAGRQVVLFGASMGAGISIAAAAREPDKIAGVIGDGVYRRGMEPVVGFFRINRWPAWLIYLPVGAHLAFWYSTPSQFDRARHASKLACPLLLLHGNIDPICPFASAEEIAKAAPRGRLVAFEGASHLDLAASDPARYRNALEEFFAELAREGGTLPRAGSEPAKAK